MKRKVSMGEHGIPIPGVTRGEKRLKKLTEAIKVDQEEAMGGMTNE